MKRRWRPCFLNLGVKWINSWLLYSSWFLMLQLQCWLPIPNCSNTMEQNLSGDAYESTSGLSVMQVIEHWFKSWSWSFEDVLTTYNFLSRLLQDSKNVGKDRNERKCTNDVSVVICWLNTLTHTKKNLQRDCQMKCDFPHVTTCKIT